MADDQTFSHSETSWPPPYAVRISAKAKYARLRILPNTGLEVVIPLGFAPLTAIDIVENNREWICRALKRVCGKPTPREETALAPQEILLRGNTLRFSTVYGQKKTGEHSGALSLRAAENDPVAAAKELQAWARLYATNALRGEVASLAQEHGMRVSALRFRRQKSRWGSCSAQGALSLNTCLVFLPQELARHVILHELAHTRHMNHGQGFWKTLFAMAPEALVHDKRLRSAWRFVPAWMWR